MVGPAQTLVKLYTHVQEQGLAVQKMDIRGKVHNPENRDLAADLCDLCSRTALLQLPEASSLQVPLRSNLTGERLLEGSLTEEIITTILASKCDWHKLLSRVAKDLEGSDRAGHKIAIFGMNDCVPMGAFHKARLRITKVAAHSLIQDTSTPVTRDPRSVNESVISENAIAITGASCRLPGANSIDELWKVLSKGRDCHREISTDRFSLYDSFRASQSGRFTDGRKFFGNFLDNVDAFDNSFFGVNIREAINMDPQQRLLLELSYEALEASGYLSSHRRDAGDNVGCFIGASLVEYLDNTNAHGPTAYTSTGTIRAFLCGRLSYHYGWRGPSEVVDTACSSSLVAINRACKAIQAGECDMALAGGVNVITGINNYLDLGKAGFLSPTGQCKPFDSLADGYCRSEGAGLVVLKRLTEAIRDGDQIMGVISGVATNQGGLSTSLTVPSSSAQEALYSTVLRQAGLQPSEVTYVEAHGPGTPAGDPIEMRSIRSVFGSPARPSTLYVGSIKGNIGHCETAAGVAGLLKVLAMIMHGAIAPQANHQQLNTNILPLGPDRMEVPRHLCAWTVPLRAALVTSYGAAGSNCALLCCEPSSGSVQNNSSSQLHCLQYESESFPILLSAATRTSLSKYSRKLAAYLQQGPKIELCNVAFTLNERRRRHKFGIYTTATNVSDLIKTLESPELHCLGLPQKSKPIVLVFSGQSSNTVSLDKTFYNNYAVFRNHIEACDLILKGLGYSSFYPAIFEHAPISDVVLLQCSIFAVQYAVARSWIDAGLKIDAMIGHSLGEVTALAVSEVLSLADCIKLVACRAHFTKMKWGAEKGAMLAIHATSEEANEIIKLVQPDSNGGKLEIACYNASSSVVVVGPTSLIHATETLLRTDTHFQRFRSQRLNTSHGFHSYLTEPILAELDALSRTLQWCDPKIPIEVCRLQHLETMQDYSVSKHAREPVFFADAVWRVEDRLGPCVWFEAGIDTSIIPLVRKASRTPDGHDFQSLSTRKAHVSAGTVTDATLKMWRNGVFVSHWGFLPVQTGSCKQIWLPPYQFDVASHWLANIDRPSELMRQSISSNSAKPQGTIAPPSPQLVFRKESTTQSQNVTEFGINTDCQRFRELVRGHAVRQRPLCPASMYMECVTMAAQILLGELSGLSLDFESLMFQTALGLDPTRETILILEELAANRSWRFTIRSCTFTGPKQQILTHACGKISLTSTPRLELFQRLIWDTINQLDKKVNVEKLMSKRAYGLFAHVVHYEPFYRGISAITLDQSEAVATAKLPEHQPGRSNTTAWRNCDTPTIDTFIQVVGLLMNSSDLVSEDQVMVAVGIDRVILSSACDMSEFKEWRVYAKFAPSHDSRSVGDVFVCSQTGEVVALLSGCRFTKLLISKLEKSLDSVNLTETPVVREPLKNEFASVPRVMPREAFTPDSESLSSRTRFVNAEATALSAENDTALRRLISGYTGLRESDVAHDISLAELGLDSLSSVEMIDELTSKFGMEITSDELITATLETLLQRIDDAGVQTVSAQAQACHKNSTGSSIMENSSSESSPRCIQNPRQLQRLLQIIADASGVESSNIQEQHTLADLGVDSLSAVDMTQQLEDSFSTQIESSQPVLQYTVKELTQLLNLGEISQSSEHSSDEATHAEDSLSSSLSWKERDHICLPNPFEALIRTEPKFETAAKEQGFTHYWTTVSPLQDKLLLAYIIEGFRALGVDLSAMQRGTMLTPIPHLPKYDKLMRRLLDILASHEIVVKQSDKILRGGGNIDARSSLQLYETFSTQHPRYESEAKLMDLTGPKLAECLSGEVDPISLMFAKSASLKIMENFYGQSPMMSTLTKLLVDFLILLLVDVKTSRQVPVRILEVGAGTGGTTMRLAKALEVAGISALYTFTDISPSLVSKAKEKLTSYPWISFSTFNLENDVTDAFRNQFDIVISTNCVHATTDRTVSCRRLRETLKEGGLLVLSEVTRFMDWYDICFGLLDGWWLAEGRSAYPLQEASAWMSTFRAAGFKSMSYSRGSTPEAMTQQLLVGSNKQWEVLDLTSEVVDGAQEIKYHLETMVYKEVSNVQIHADVYIPETRQDSPMPFGTRSPKVR